MNNEPERPVALRLATKLQEHIRKDGLKPGDTFLSAEVAARQFGVRKSVANQALQILAHRGLVVRKRKLGAVIAPATDRQPELQRIVLVKQIDYPDSGAPSDGAITSGLQSIFPGADTQLFAASEPDPAKRIDQLIRNALQDRTPSGFIVMRGSPTIQASIADSGIPAVVHGSVWPGVELPSVNVDNRSIGVMLTEVLLTRTSGAILLLRRDRTSPGENELLQGTLDATRNAGRRLEVLEAPETARSVRIALRDRLSSIGDDCAVLAATALLASQAVRQVPPARVAVAAIRAAPGHPRLLRCEADLDDHQQGEMLGRLLRKTDRPPGRNMIPCHIFPRTN
ncbi:MAG: hypothetical protein ACTSYE_01170 [Alphaproteobacteria bacterium]